MNQTYSSNIIFLLTKPSHYFFEWWETNLHPNRHVLVPFAMLVVVLAAASVYAITSFQTGVNIAVHEPITWTPLNANVDAWAGESKSYTVRICNAAAIPITVKFQPAVSVTPTGGLSNDISFKATVNRGTNPVTPPLTNPLIDGTRGSHCCQPTTGL